MPRLTHIAYRDWKFHVVELMSLDVEALDEGKHVAIRTGDREVLVVERAGRSADLSATIAGWEETEWLGREVKRDA